MDLESKTFAKEWSLKWAQGVVHGLVDGTLDPARAYGMLRTAQAKFGLSRGELEAILRAEEASPVHSAAMTRDEMRKRLRSVRKAFWEE